MLYLQNQLCTSDYYTLYGHHYFRLLIFVTYWGQNKMADNLQMTFSVAFLWKNIFVFWFTFHNGLSLNRWQAISKTNNDPVHRHIAITRLQKVNHVGCLVRNGVDALYGISEDWSGFYCRTGCNVILSQCHECSDVADARASAVMVFSHHCPTLPELLWTSTVTFNSLWLSDVIWRHKSGSAFAQVMASCLTASSHYLNQC